ncbi:MAG: hypothetical protein ACFFEV_09280 [Candidatus Thorarchaeota archaeon]
MKTDIVQSLLEQSNILSQGIMALLLVIGFIALVLYAVGTNVSSLIKEKLGA